MKLYGFGKARHVAVKDTESGCREFVWRVECVYMRRGGYSAGRIREVIVRDGLCQKDDQIGGCRFQRVFDNMIVMSRISCGNLIAKQSYGARQHTALIIASTGDVRGCTCHVESANIRPPQECQTIGEEILMWRVLLFNAKLDDRNSVQ